MNDDNLISLSNEIYQLLKKYNASIFYETIQYESNHAQIELRYMISFENVKDPEFTHVPVVPHTNDSNCDNPACGYTTEFAKASTYLPNVIFRLSQRTCRKCGKHLVDQYVEVKEYTTGQRTIPVKCDECNHYMLYDVIRDKFVAKDEFSK